MAGTGWEEDEPVGDVALEVVDDVDVEEPDEVELVPPQGAFAAYLAVGSARATPSVSHMAKRIGQATFRGSGR
ncbi:hypothetical protein ACWDA7_39690 [Streptomyces sp. NPDC001156]